MPTEEIRMKRMQTTPVTTLTGGVAAPIGVPPVAQIAATKIRRIIGIKMSETAGAAAVIALSVRDAVGGSIRVIDTIMIPASGRYEARGSLKRPLYEIVMAAAGVKASLVFGLDSNAGESVDASYDYVDEDS